MASADWDLGQKLIEQGACTMDQVREILSLQDRLRKMGASSKPFARVLLEKGYVRREQLVRAGVRESDLPPRVEERPAPESPATASPSRRPVVVAALLLVAVGALVLLGRGAFTAAPAGPAEPSKPLSEEELDAFARTHLERITEAAEKSPSFDNAPEVVCAHRFLRDRRATGGRKLFPLSQRRQRWRKRSPHAVKAARKLIAANSFSAEPVNTTT